MNSQRLNPLRSTSLDTHARDLLSSADGREALLRLEAEGQSLVTMCLNAIMPKLEVSRERGIALPASEAGLVLQMCRCAPVRVCVCWFMLATRFT